jgi:hypothetical protein
MPLTSRPPSNVFIILCLGYPCLKVPSIGPQGAAAPRDGTRELVITRYLYILMYELRFDVIAILRVLHTSQ